MSVKDEMQAERQIDDPILERLRERRDRKRDQPVGQRHGVNRLQALADMRNLQLLHQEIKAKRSKS